MKLIGWKLYYDDGLIFSSKDGDWFDAPGDGIQVLVEYYDDGSRKIHLERDYYILDDGKAYGTNNIYPYLHKKKEIKFGRWMNDDNFQSLVKKAKNEPLQ